MTDSIESAIGETVRGGVPGLCLIVDADDKVVEASPTTLEALGPQILGARFGGLLVPAPWTSSPTATVGATRERRLLTLATSSGLPQTFDCWLVRHQDKVIIVGGLDPNDAERLRREMLTLNQELSARTRELQKANVEIARAGALKDLMLGMAAHDLRTPLMVVTSCIGFLREDMWDQMGPDQRELVKNIEEAGTYMTNIIKAFLDVALIQAGKLQIERKPESLEDIAQQAVRLVSPAARRADVTIRLQVATALPTAHLDGPKVQQAIVNLLSNAVRHSPAGGEVALDLGLRDGAFLVEVRDHGTGIPPEIESDLFRAFTHGANTRGERGIGLGLAITRRIMEGHGGSIDVQSHRGQGASFTLRLPMSADGAGAST